LRFFLFSGYVMGAVSRAKAGFHLKGIFGTRPQNIQIAPVFLGPKVERNGEKRVFSFHFWERTCDKNSPKKQI